MDLSSFKFSWWTTKNACFKTECVMALPGHSRSILAPINSAYATSYWSSIVNLVLSCPVSLLFYPNFRGVPFGLNCRFCDSEELIIRVITFELTQHIRPRYFNARDGRLAITNTALALRASRGKNRGKTKCRTA